MIDTTTHATDSKKPGVRKAVRTKWNRTTGPRTRSEKEMVIPFRLTSSLVKKLDRALQRAGYKSRSEAFREALATLLKRRGEKDVADAVLAA